MHYDRAQQNYNINVSEAKLQLIFYVQSKLGGVCVGKHMSRRLSLLLCSCQCHIYRLLCRQRHQVLGVNQQQRAFIGVLDQLAPTEVDLSPAREASACVACVSLVDVAQECSMVGTGNERETERDRERGTERHPS